MSATISDLLLAAEYIMSEGNHQVILCERGIRTFETYTRNTLDISAIPVVHKLSHLPIIVDPSHAIGIRDKVPPLRWRREQMDCWLRSTTTPTTPSVTEPNRYAWSNSKL